MHFIIKSGTWTRCLLRTQTRSHQVRVLKPIISTAIYNFMLSNRKFGKKKDRKNYFITFLEHEQTGVVVGSTRFLFILKL